MALQAAVPAATAALKSLATRVAQSDTARELAKTAATATGEALTQKALAKLDSGRPASRTSEAGAGHALAPRKALHTKPSATLDAPFEQPAFASTIDEKNEPLAPPTYAESQTGNHGTLLQAEVPTPLPTYEQATQGQAAAPMSGRLDSPPDLPASMPAGPRPGRPALPARPAAQPAPTVSTKPVATARPPATEAPAKKSSFRQALRSFFGLSGTTPSTPRPTVNAGTTVGGRYEGQPIELRLSRQRTRAFQQEHGISNQAFDTLQYLRWEQSRQDPLRPANVRVTLGGQDTNLTTLDLDQVEFNQFDANRRATAG